MTAMPGQGPRNSSRLLRSLLCALLLLLVACESRVTRVQGEQEALEIVAELSKSGVEARAESESGARGWYAIRVPSSLYERSARILAERGLPRKNEESFADLIAQRGLIPNSREVEELRVEYALARQVEELLTGHAQIEKARVVIRRSEDAAPSATVVVQERAAGAVSRDDLIAIVANAVPGLTAENIRIAIQQSNRALQSAETQLPEYEKFLFFWRVAPGDDHMLSVALFICLLLALGAGGFIGFWYGYYKQSRAYFDEDIGTGAGIKSLRERSKRDLLGV